MHRRTAALFGGLVVALAGLPTRATPEPAQVPRPAGATDPLTIAWMFCESLGACEAQATGGTGVYDFTWRNALWGDDIDGWSTAFPKCYGSGVTITVTATVTDGSGAQASKSIRYNC